MTPIEKIRGELVAILKRKRRAPGYAHLSEQWHSGYWEAILDLHAMDVTDLSVETGANDDVGDDNGR